MFDLIVIGAGPAGSAAAITAARDGAHVLLLEKGRFPRHKVCGEFVSAESLDLLSSLLVHSAQGKQLIESAPRIHASRIFLDNNVVEAQVEPAAASITRFELDAALWDAALAAGVEGRQQITADNIKEELQYFNVMTSFGELKTRSIIDASGRWSKLAGPVAERNGERWLGLKAHFREANTSSSTDLYFFDGGYCGVQPIGPELINVCAMCRSNRATSLPQVWPLHRRLEERSRGWTQQTEAVSTSPLIFRAPTPVRTGALCAGDAAGFIDPFAGDGISLALRTGAAAAHALIEFWRGGIDLQTARNRYSDEYARRFLPIFKSAARVRQLLNLPRPLRYLATQALRTPAVARYVVRSTRVG